MPSARLRVERYGNILCQKNGENTFSFYYNKISDHLGLIKLLLWIFCGPQSFGVAYRKFWQRLYLAGVKNHFLQDMSNGKVQILRFTEINRIQKFLAHAAAWVEVAALYKLAQIKTLNLGKKRAEAGEAYP